MRRQLVAIALLGGLSLTACTSHGDGGAERAAGPTAGASGTSTGGVSATGTAAGSGAGTTTAAGGVARNSALCAQLLALSAQLTTAEGSSAGATSTSTSNPTSAQNQFTQVIAALKDIKAGAPANVAAAVDDLTIVFEQAEASASNPAALATKLASLSSKLPADSQTIGAYLASCGPASPTGSPTS